MAAEKVSRRIRYYMDQRKIDIDKLASLTGLDREFLDTMLDADLLPPLGPLMKIARALGVRLGTFLDDQDSKDPFIVKKAQRNSDINVPAEKGKADSLRFHSLGRGKKDRHMEPFYVEILPGSADSKTLSSHEGEEFIVVTGGRIEVIYGDDTYILKEGDSIYYNSVVPHYVSCAGEEAATIYAVIYIS